MRAPILVLALLLAGCSAPDATPAEEPALRILALDGRWAFDPARGAALLAEAGAPAPVGEIVFVEALAPRRVADVAGVDDAAARALGLDPPRAGEALVLRAWAEHAGVAQGDALALRAHAFPTPYVATFFEMERTPQCERRDDAKLCFLPEERASEARLRLRVDAGARDAAFLPDLVELGPGGRPAYWNGSFESPGGARHPFAAYAGLDNVLTPGELRGAMEEGHWTIRFTLTANGTLAPAGAAGIVRVREPGYLWFDDRLGEIVEPLAQARAVLANATPTRAEARVARVVDELPLGAHVLLPLDDARALAGTRQATALLASLTPGQERALAAAAGPDGLTAALRPRPLPGAPEAAPAGDALVFAAPHDVDLASLPRVEGAHAPALALAGRAPLGERFEAEGRDVHERLLLLAHAGGDAAFALPAGGRWSDVAHAFENLSRSRTLALGSEDLVTGALATVRLDSGSGHAIRSMVAIGAVEGGPSRALWTSAALVAGAGHPVNPRVLLPVEPGADRDEVARRALEAWAEAGVVLDR